MKDLTVEVISPSALSTTLDMKIGDIGIVHGPIEQGTVLLRTYEGLVSLGSPRSTWRTDSKYDPNFPVRILKHGDTVILRVRK